MQQNFEARCGNGRNTRFRPGEAELHRCFTALKVQRRGILGGPRYARVGDA